jgi:hypothetical protein
VSYPSFFSHNVREKPGLCNVLSQDNRSSKKLDNNINSDIMSNDAIGAILRRIRRNPKNVRFNDLLRVCDYYFGPPRQRGGSHRVYKTPWPGDPRINIQNEKGMAKAYQVKQVLIAIDKLEAKNEPEQ